MDDTPTFLVIGAARSGTTALYDLLRQHPSVYMSPIKEPNYFAFEGEPKDWRGPGNEFVNNSVATWDAYRALFAPAPAGSARGEASPLHLWAPKAPERIKARIPDVKLVAILRNPVEQAFSHYLYARAQMIEPLDSFDAALDAMSERLAAHWQPLFQYSDFPRYGEQIARFLEHFREDRLLVFLYEDYRDDPKAMLRKIFAHIGVDPDFDPDVEVDTNMGGQPKQAWLQNLVMRPNVLANVVGRFIPNDVRRAVRDMVSRRNLARDRMSDAARSRLKEALRDDISQLQGILKRDLSHWLQ